MDADEVNEALLKLNSNMDQLFLIIMGMIVFFMQCGFAFLEAGAVRIKNTTNILMKNMMDCAIAAIVYWAIGYALAFGKESNAFIGYSYFVTFDQNVKNAISAEFGILAVSLPDWWFLRTKSVIGTFVQTVRAGIF